MTRPNKKLPDFQNTAIAGVEIVSMDTHHDNRGIFKEIFREEWFPLTDWNIVQFNHSISYPGALRGLHYHLKQTDYIQLITGHLCVGLYDNREASTTYGNSLILDFMGNDSKGIIIPPGVIHGHLALQHSSILYALNQYYDETDEYGVAWNDPTVNILWDLGNTSLRGILDVPILSDRDKVNPPLIEPEIPMGVSEAMTIVCDMARGYMLYDGECDEEQLEEKKEQQKAIDTLYKEIGQ